MSIPKMSGIGTGINPSIFSRPSLAHSNKNPATKLHGGIIRQPSKMKLADGFMRGSSAGANRFSFGANSHLPSKNPLASLSSHNFNLSRGLSNQALPGQSEKPLSLGNMFSHMNLNSIREIMGQAFHHHNSANADFSLAENAHSSFPTHSKIVGLNLASRTTTTSLGGRIKQPSPKANLGCKDSLFLLTIS